MKQFSCICSIIPFQSASIPKVLIPSLIAVTVQIECRLDKLEKKEVKMVSKSEKSKIILYNFTIFVYILLILLPIALIYKPFTLIPSLALHQFFSLSHIMSNHTKLFFIRELNKFDSFSHNP